MYSSTLSLISALRGGGWSTPRPSRFTPGKNRHSLYRRLGGPRGRSVLVQNISPSLGFDPRTVQPVARRYTDWAIRAHIADCMCIPKSTVVFRIHVALPPTWLHISTCTLVTEDTCTNLLEPAVYYDLKSLSVEVTKQRNESTSFGKLCRHFLNTLY
jgi:hypothetical protein